MMKAHRPTQCTAWIIFLLTWGVYILLSQSLVSPSYVTARDRSYLMGGDEPWYLLCARSLAYDLDFNIDNDCKQHGSLDFWDRDIQGPGYERHMKMAHGRAAQPEYWQDRRYLVVRMGLPLLLAPSYRLGVWWHNNIRVCCVWFMCLLGATLVAQLFMMTHELTGRTATAAAAAVAGGLSAPLLFYTTQLYTELPAALLVLIAMRQLFTSSAPRAARACVAGFSLAYLPWLHDKYYLLCFLLVAAALAVFHPRHIGEWVGLILPLAISLGLQGWYYHIQHGVIYPVSDHGALSLETGWKSGWPGLLLDRTDGLFVYFPAALMGVAGLLVNRQGHPFYRWALALVAVHWFTTGLFPTWTGGPSAPLRYWTPVIPLLAVGIASLWCSRTAWVTRGALVALAALSIYIGLFNQTHPRRFFRDNFPVDFPERHFTKYSGKLVNAFPDMKEPLPRDYRHAVGWSLALILAGGFLVRAKSPVRGSGKGNT